MSIPFKELLSELEMISFKERIIDRRKPVASSALLADFFETLPFPAWIKVLDEEGNLRMAYVNKAYEQYVGISLEDYFSKEDSDVHWKDAVVAQFHENDLKAISEKKAVETTEIADHHITGKESVWKGHKWPILRNDGVVAVCGYALLPAELKE